MRDGDLVEDFELLDQFGVPRRLSTLLESGPVVLFFYPLANSRGCTAESCHFRDLAAEFGALHAQRVGISADEVSAQHRFSESHGFDYPLLSDPQGVIAERFGVRRRFGPLPVKRQTFVIGTDGRVVGSVRSEVSMRHHADQALVILRGLR